MSRRTRQVPPPEPPVALPEGRVAHLPGRGEVFFRDTGGDGPVVMLLHGWMFPADLNWFTAYRPLADAGYRVLAVDHRGHGRGLRPLVPFRLDDCADDAAALAVQLGVTSLTAVGYSMGGPVAQLMARRHPDVVTGLVCCATSLSWRSPQLWLFWHSMAGLRLMLGLAPYSFWRWLLRASGAADDATTSWLASELSRGSARDLAEAGRELGRYDSSGWVGELPQRSAVVLTTRDRSVPPRWQRRLAAALDAPVFEVAADHSAPVLAVDELVRALLGALAAVAAAPVDAGTTASESSAAA